MKEPTDEQIKTAMERTEGEQTIFMYREHDLYCGTLVIRRKRGRDLIKEYCGNTIRELRNKLRAVGAEPSRRWTNADFERKP